MLFRFFRFRNSVKVIIVKSSGGKDYSGEFDYESSEVLSI